ncbi:MAG: ABC transporter permease subunit [Sulfuritalea sp.]|nr:ABC transporter permease subunit [Sulfuritalea sp.]
MLYLSLKHTHGSLIRHPDHAGDAAAGGAAGHPLAGYVGGWVDDLIQYLYTTLSSIPGVLLIAAAVLMMGGDQRHPSAVVLHVRQARRRAPAGVSQILGMTSWTGVARLLRGETLKLREPEFVQGAQAFGAGRFAIMGRQHPAQPDAHRADRAGDGLLGPGAGRGRAVPRRRRRRSEHDLLRHRDQHRANGTGARAHSLVVAAGRLRLHVRPGARRQPVRRRGARRLRSEAGGKRLCG